ncbi:hypothetical protein PYCCODRAFT_746796 [Trametes coccinea BRFM310]|uniref:DOMON domain-containing protein n=1 Tax=Trametes coccinea (strain BRFM310) TaxID=1353009 RepID=A0A1Y2IJ66_TRAC3|nr:hypothetical protein PYCCODRAFT_746796 [Trametes coccinea BRFM310]
MNVNQLQPPPQPQLQRVSREASEKEADFLALRLLNKRSRLRLSPQALDLDALPGKGRLFAAANRAGWFAAATRQSDNSYALVLSPLTDLRSVFSSASSDGPLSIQPRVTLSLPATPQIVVFTQDDARLLVAFTNGSISVYDAQSVFQSSSTSPLHNFPSGSGKAIKDLLPCPGEMSLVAVLREPGDSLAVEIIDVQKMSSVGGWNGGGSPTTTPVSASWSPKGKQIALGLASGELVTFAPGDTASIKSVVPRPSVADNQSVISALWLSNPEFHAIYTPLGQFAPDVEQSHYILSLDSKANTAGDVKLSTPYLPFPGLRPPGSFIVVLRGWEPSRLLLFIGDSTSSDIGLVGSLSDSGAAQIDSWYNLTLEETSTPSVPLDADMNETVLLGLELDLTNDQPFKYTGPSGEESDVPPPPIMYLYASDGTLTGWHIIQTQGVAYPGMVTSSGILPTTSPAVATAPSTSPAPQSAFASPAAQTASPSQPSAFGSTSTGSAFGGGGFGAFSGTPAKFGSGSSFGFGTGAQTSPSQSLQAPPLSTPSMSVEMSSSAPEDSMVSETDTGLGGMSLGGDGGSSQQKSGGGLNSMFGSFGNPQQQNATSSSPFGAVANASPTFAAFGSGPVKPATGFGASAFGSSSSFGGGGAFSSGSAFSGGSTFGSKPATDSNASTSASTESKPASAFGQPAFGQPAFGATAAKPAFGQPAFGQSSFGQSSPGSAFGGGASAFGSKPATTGEAEQPASSESKPASAFGQPAFGQSGFGAAAAKPAFGQSTFGQASFGKPSFGQPAFGSSSFGAAATTPTKPASTSAFGGSGGGGFAAFASAPTSFASAAQQQTTPDAKPAWASGASSQQAEQKPAESTTTSGSVFGGSGAFGSGKAAEAASSATPSTGSAFAGLGQANQNSGSTFGQTSFGQSSFGQSSFGQQSTFGQTAFGKPAFGQPTTPTSTPPRPASSASSGGAFSAFANTGPSAFGAAAAAQKSPSGETKPVWAAGAADKLKEQEKSMATFASAASPSSIFGGSESAPEPASTTPASSPEKPVAPATPAATPPATPESKPAAAPAPSTAPATPATGGAFGGLTTTSNAFSKGFGAFGGTTTPASSPFLQKPSGTTQPSSVFGQTSFGASKTDDKDSTTKPPSAFGTPSPLGQSFFGKSSFSPSSSPFAKPAAAATTSTNAFSAFSSGSSPFAAAASATKKSFGDMLREKDGEKAEEKPRAVSKTAEEWKKPVSVFASLKQAAAEKGEDDVKKEEEEDLGNTSFRSYEDDDEEEVEGSDAGDDGIDDFLKSDEEPGSDEDEEEGEGEAVQSITPPESPTAKQPIRSKSPSAPFVGGIFVSKDKRSPSPTSSLPPVPIVKVEPESPKSIPLRDGSSTPPGSPSERKSPSPDERATTEAKGKAPAREGSTTPPGSPASTSAARATSAPPTSSPSPGATSGHLGLGRPSTRPVRSSPLASQPISGDDLSDEEGAEEGEEDEESGEGAEGEEEDEDEDEADEEEPTSAASSPKKARSASPAIPSLSIKGAAPQPTSRPKTPPLLFGGPAKPPTPSPFTLTPAASPSPLFGPKAPAPPVKPVAEPAKPATAAPTPKAGGPGSIFSSAPVFTPPTLPPGGLFGQKPLVPSTGGLFGQKPAGPPASAFGGPGVFSAPPTPPTGKPSSPSPPAAASAPSEVQPPSLFGSGGGFGSLGQPGKPSAFGGFGGATVPQPLVPPAASQVPQTNVAQDMQTECLYLYTSLSQELEDLKALASRASVRATQLGRPGTGNKTIEDLTDPTKWLLGDLPQFKQLMKEVERELGKWQKEKAVLISHIRELESDMLKATTRKEEIARFSRASQDAEFARMLKARTLSPEYLEMQAQLRREIRTIRGRVQQLEDHIQASKKKLNSLKNGKPTLKPPSLDTINRTYRNIDLAIEQEEEDVSRLADRVAQLDLTSHSRGLLSFSASASTRDKRLPDRTERIGREVTPNIAASTAAALNAERSAQKLKRALLSARKEPLLNTKAVNALPPEREIRTSRKPFLAPDSGLGIGAAFAAGMNSALPPSFPPFSPSPPSIGSSPSYQSQADSEQNAWPRSGRTGALRSEKKNHARSAQFSPSASNPAYTPLPPPAGFSWGPVPKIEPKTTISVFSNLSSSWQANQEEPEVKVKEEEQELGSSWVADGFGK